MVEIIIINKNIVVYILKKKYHYNLFSITGGRHFEDDGRKRNDNDGRKYNDDDGRKRNDDDGGKRNDDDHRRSGGQDRVRYGGPSRRDHESGRTGKYNHPQRGIR